MNMIEEAIKFAKEKHASQLRKGTNWSYIVHLYEVAQILRENGADEETIVCGILHDTVEDTSATLDEIKDLFGDNVANIIGIESENKQLPYRERKYEHMQRVEKAPIKAKMVNCADKLSNLKSIYLDYKYVQDDSYFNRFKGSKEDMKWYYGIALIALKDVENFKMYKELKSYYKAMFFQEFHK